MVGAQTSPITLPATSSKVGASSTTPVSRFGPLSSLFGPSQMTTVDVQAPHQGGPHRCEDPRTAQIHAPSCLPTPFRPPSPRTAGFSIPACLQQTSDKAILSHTMSAVNHIPIHPSSSVSVRSNGSFSSSAGPHTLPGLYDKHDRSDMFLSPSGLPTSSGQWQEGRRAEGAEYTSIKSPAQLMMAEMESRRPWGVRILEAHSNTTEAIQSLQQTCSAIADGQRSTRDKIFEVQNALKTLPTKEDIWEELNDQLPGLLETSLQPVLDKFHNSLEALPPTLGTLVDRSIRAEADRIVEAIRQIQAEKQSPRPRASTEEPLVDLMKHMIAALQPLHKLSSTVPILESFSEVFPALKALPGAVESVAIFQDAMVKLGERTKYFAAEPQLPTSAPQAGPKDQPALPSRVNVPRFSALLEERSPDMTIDALMAEVGSRSPGDTPLQLGQESPVLEQVHLYSPRLRPISVNRGPVPKPMGTTGMQVIVDELTKLSAAIGKMENRFEQAFHSATERTRIVADPPPSPSWMEKLDKRLEAIEQVLALSARHFDSTGSMRTPDHHAQTTTHLPTPASSSQPLPPDGTTEPCANNESAAESPSSCLEGPLIDILDSPPQDVFGPICPVSAGGTESTSDLSMSRPGHPVSQPVPSAPGCIAEGARGTKKAKKRPSSSSASRPPPKRTKTPPNRAPPSSQPLRRSPRRAAHGEPIELEAEEVAQPSNPVESCPDGVSQITSNTDRTTVVAAALIPLPTEPICDSSNSKESTGQVIVETFVDPPSARTRGAAGIRKEIIQLKNKHIRTKSQTSVTDSQDSGAPTAMSDHLKSKEETTGLTTSSSSSDDSRASDYAATKKKKASHAKRKKRSKSGTSSAFKPAQPAPPIKESDGKAGHPRPGTTKSPPRDAFGRFIGGGVTTYQRTFTESRPFLKMGARAPSILRPSLSFRSTTLSHPPPTQAMSSHRLSDQTATSIRGDVSSTLGSLQDTQNSAAAQPHDVPPLQSAGSYPETGASVFYESLVEGQHGAGRLQGGAKDLSEVAAMGHTSSEQTLQSGQESAENRAEEVSNVASYYGLNKVQGRDLNGELSDEG